MFRLKSHQGFLRFFVRGHLFWSGDTKRDAFVLADTQIQVLDLLLSMDSEVIYIHFRRSQLPVSLKMMTVIYLIREMSAI